MRIIFIVIILLLISVGCGSIGEKKNDNNRDSARKDSIIALDKSNQANGQGSSNQNNLPKENTNAPKIVTVKLKVINSLDDKHNQYTIHILSNGKEYKDIAILPIDKYVNTNENGEVVVEFHPGIEYHISVYPLASPKKTGDKTKIPDKAKIQGPLYEKDIVGPTQSTTIKLEIK